MFYLDTVPFLLIFAWLLMWQFEAGNILTPKGLTVRVNLDYLLRKEKILRQIDFTGVTRGRNGCLSPGMKMLRPW